MQPKDDLTKQFQKFYFLFIPSKFYLDASVSSVRTPSTLEFVSSIKGGYQLCLDGYNFTRHRLRGNTTYWRCVQFRPLRCKARVRTRADGKQLEIVEREHNHKILRQRRKKGSLKAFYEQRKRDALAAKQARTTKG